MASSSTHYDFQGASSQVNNRASKQQYLLKLQKQIDEVMNLMIMSNEEGIPEKVIRGLI